MAEPCSQGTAPRNQVIAVRVARLAERQWGVITWAQLRACGLSKATVGRWVQGGRLHRIYPGVYAVGHRAVPRVGWLAAALFHAGPGAALSYMTAAWWWGLLRIEPRHVHLSVPSARRVVPELRVHRPRTLERTWHNRLPVTPVARTLLDIAAEVSERELLRALAEAEYLRLVTLDEVDAVLGRGLPGTANLRAALDRHRPELARTLSVLEERFLALCDGHGISLPEVNVKVGGFTVDALWREHELIVELDGHAAHATPTAMERDRRRELTLRAAGYRVHRYTWRQITRQPEVVVADLVRCLSSIPSAHERRRPCHD